MQSRLADLQDMAREAVSWADLQPILEEAYELRYIGEQPSINAKTELLYSPKTTLKRLKLRGWTDKLVEAFLPAPHLHPHPHGGRSPLRMWLISDVQRMEKVLKAELVSNQLKKKAKSQKEVVNA
jgi:hypothetical protein